LLRGDIAQGNEQMMEGAEQRGLPYLFKLRQSKGVAQLIADWRNRGRGLDGLMPAQGWEGVESELQLQGWSRARQVIVLRRRLRERPKVEPEQTDQLCLPGCVMEHKGGDWYEHAVLVTSWEERDLLAIAQASRSRRQREHV
jgi:hypothetical protein